MVGFINTLFTQFGTTGNYGATAELHTLQFSVTHAPGFSFFTSHILVTDLYASLSLQNTLKSSLYCLIHFLTLFCIYQLNSIPLLPSSYPGRLANRNSTSFFCPVLYYDRRSVGQSVLVSSPHLGLMTRFLLLSDHCGFFIWGALSDERTGLFFTMYNMQYILLSQMRQGPCIYIPQEQGGPVIPPGTGYPDLFSSFSTELFFKNTLHGPRRKYSLSIVVKACLQRLCIVTEVTRLLFAYL
jgi:hypothetical protein